VGRTASFSVLKFFVGALASAVAAALFAYPVNAKLWHSIIVGVVAGIGGAISWRFAAAKH
jgi:CDP-diglyceride synthetase